MKKCVVIIPALNEEKTIGRVIDDVPVSIFDEDVRFEVVVVNDGSTDGTEDIAKRHGAYVINHDHPMGVGTSFSDGIREALQRQADYAVNIDADGQMNPKDIEKLLKPLIGGVSDMVTASRFMDKDNYPKMQPIKKWGNDTVAKIVSFIVGSEYHDVSCGFRAYNREALLRLNLYGSFTYTQETFINLAGSGQIRIIEIPVEIRGEREFGKSRVASSILRYAMRSGSIILSAFKDYKPVRFFGGLSLLTFLIGVVFETIMMVYFIIAGHFSNYLWAGLTGAFFAITSLIFLILMIVSDTLSKMRRTNEEVLYFEKKREYYGNDNIKDIGGYSNYE